MARDAYVTVTDAAGIERRVRRVDAREIEAIAQGVPEPLTYTEADAIAQNDGVDESTAAKKKAAKAK